MYIAYMKSRGSSCTNLLGLNCQWFDISKSYILVHCWFGNLRYQCRSVVLETAELSVICIILLEDWVPWYITVYLLKFVL